MMISHFSIKDNLTIADFILDKVREVFLIHPSDFILHPSTLCLAGGLRYAGSP